MLLILVGLEHANEVAGLWFCESGRRVIRTARCRDRAAASRVARQWARWNSTVSAAAPTSTVLLEEHVDRKRR